MITKCDDLDRITLFKQQLTEAMSYLKNKKIIKTGEGGGTIELIATEQDDLIAQETLNQEIMYEQINENDLTQLTTLSHMNVAAEVVTQGTKFTVLEDINAARSLGRRYILRQMLYKICEVLYIKTVK